MDPICSLFISFNECGLEFSSNIPRICLFMPIAKYYGGPVSRECFVVVTILKKTPQLRNWHPYHENYGGEKYITLS